MKTQSTESNHANNASGRGVESNVRGRNGASQRAKDSAHNTSGVAGEFHNFIQDIEDLLKSTTSMTSEDMTRVKEAINERISTAKESIEEMGSALGERARHTAKVTDEYVHEHSWQAIGIGAAVGLLLGLTLSRRN